MEFPRADNLRVPADSGYGTETGKGRGRKEGGSGGGEEGGIRRKRVGWMVPETRELADVSEPQSSIDGAHRSV